MSIKVLLPLFLALAAVTVNPSLPAGADSQPEVTSPPVAFNPLQPTATGAPRSTNAPVSQPARSAVGSTTFRGPVATREAHPEGLAEPGATAPATAALPNAASAEAVTTEPPVVTGIEFYRLPDELQEGQTVSLQWRSGPGIYSVAATVSWENTKLGGASRGGEDFVLQQPKPFPNGATLWEVPWIDGVAVTFRLKAFKRNADVLATAEVTVPYRPTVMRDRLEDGIYVWLRGPHGERVYRQENGHLVASYLCSGAANYRLPNNSNRPMHPHNHYGVFRVYTKERVHVSSFNDAWRMQYSMFFHSGHALHATSRNMYRHLGRPASHGCVRLHLNDARRLYGVTSRGTRVEVF